MSLPSAERVNLVLLYQDIRLARVDDLKTDMYRENGRLDFDTDLNQQLPQNRLKLRRQLVRWIELTREINRYNRELDGEAFNRNPVVDAIWREREQLPNFAEHDDWKLLFADTGRIDELVTIDFDGDRGYWTISPPARRQQGDDSIFGLRDWQATLLAITIGMLITGLILYFD